MQMKVIKSSQYFLDISDTRGFPDGYDRFFFPLALGLQEGDEMAP